MHLEPENWKSVVGRILSPTATTNKSKPQISNSLNNLKGSANLKFRVKEIF